MVRRGDHAGGTVALLALAPRSRSELVGHLGTAPRPSVDPPRRVPLDPPSHVCIDLAIWFGTRPAAAELARRMVSFDHIRDPVFCPSAARRADDARPLRRGVPPVHAANGAVVSADHCESTPGLT